MAMTSSLSMSGTRIEMPDLKLLMEQSNALLRANFLPLCDTLVPVGDMETANPNVVGLAGERKYVIKVNYRFPEKLGTQVYLANAIRERSLLPIPQHYCYADDASLLPITIMEWLPGRNLAQAFPGLSELDGKRLARDWGICVARFQKTVVEREEWGTSPPDPTGIYRWWKDAWRRKCAALRGKPGFPGYVVTAIEQYMNFREKDVSEPWCLGLTKGDLDLRDFLTRVEPSPHISGLLDWECLSIGDTLLPIAWIYGRFLLMGQPQLWPAFRLGYELAMGHPLQRCPHWEYYLMLRLISAAPDPKASALINDILGSSELPFDLPSDLPDPTK